MNGVSWLANILVDKAVEKGASYFIRHRDFRFFSVYYVNLPGKENDSKIMGFFGTFITLSQ